MNDGKKFVDWGSTAAYGDLKSVYIESQETSLTWMMFYWSTTANVHLLRWSLLTRLMETHRLVGSFLDFAIRFDPAH